MEAYPLCVLAQHQPARNQQLRKLIRHDPLARMPPEINPATPQQVYRVRAEHILAQVKVEVELPCAYFLGHVSVFVCEGEADLDDAQEVDVAPHSLVVVVPRGAKDTYGSGDHAWKLGVLYAFILMAPGSHGKQASQQRVGGERRDLDDSGLV